MPNDARRSAACFCASVLTYFISHTYYTLLVANPERTACSCKLILGFYVASYGGTFLQRSRAFTAQGRSNKITIFSGDKM